jgi:putative redox protein
MPRKSPAATMQAFVPWSYYLSAWGCSGMDVISILRKKRQPVSGLDINVQGQRADSYPKIYKEIHIEYVVKGKGVENEAVERAIALSLEKYCSVSATLSKAGTITHSYKIVEA